MISGILQKTTLVVILTVDNPHTYIGLDFRRPFSVNWLIPTLQGVYPAGRNTLPAHKRECFPPISDSSARKCKRVLLHFARPTSPVRKTSHNSLFERTK